MRTIRGTVTVTASSSVDGPSMIRQLGCICLSLEWDQKPASTGLCKAKCMFAYSFI